MHTEERNIFFPVNTQQNCGDEGPKIGGWHTQVHNAIYAVTLLFTLEI